VDIILGPHSRKRMRERGATEKEVIETVKKLDRYPAKNGVCYRRNFQEKIDWRGKVYDNKQLNVYAVKKNETVVVQTVIVKYSRRAQ